MASYVVTFILHIFVWGVCICVLVCAVVGMFLSKIYQAFSCSFRLHLDTPTQTFLFDALHLSESLEETATTF